MRWCPSLHTPAHKRPCPVTRAHESPTQSRQRSHFPAPRGRAAAAAGPCSECFVPFTPPRNCRRYGLSFASLFCFLSSCFVAAWHHGLPLSLGLWAPLLSPPAEGTRRWVWVSLWVGSGVHRTGGGTTVSRRRLWDFRGLVTHPPVVATGPGKDLHDRDRGGCVCATTSRWPPAQALDKDSVAMAPREFLLGWADLSLLI